MAKKKTTIEDEVKTTVTDHVQEKVSVLEEKAKVETVWYKKLGYYVAAAIGAVVIQAVNTYGDQLLELVKGLF